MEMVDVDFLESGDDILHKDLPLEIGGDLDEVFEIAINDSDIVDSSLSEVSSHKWSIDSGTTTSTMTSNSRSNSEEKMSHAQQAYVPKNMTTKPGCFQSNLKIPVECTVCLEESTQTYSFAKCGHTYCLSCTKRHLTEQIYSLKGEKVTCMHLKCKSRVSLSDLHMIVDPVIYDKFLLYNKIRDHQYTRMKVVLCLGCDSPLSQIDDDTTELNTIVCDSPTCGAEMCIPCHTFSHPGINCAENKENLMNAMSEDEKRTYEMFSAEGYRACPKCKSIVFREKGCEYISCARCGHGFCYLCLEPHSHNSLTHEHGPLLGQDIWSDPQYQNRLPPVKIRATGKEKAKRIAKIAGYSLLYITIGSPILIFLGFYTIGYVAYKIPSSLIKTYKTNKKIKKSNVFYQWCLNEKKRREELGLPVCEYISRNASKLKKPLKYKVRL